MGFLAWLIVGLVAGVLAKAIMPGSSKEPSGWIMTIVLGIVGAFVGGWLGSAIFNVAPNNMIMQIVFATVGALVIIGVLRMLSGRRAV